MKRRKGFVSNSSTSSFVCNVCGAIESDMGLCMKEAKMFECEHGHCTHFDCVKLESDVVDKICSGEIDDHEVPSKYCPACTLDEIGNYDLLKFALIKLKVTKKELVEEIKSKFNTLQELKDAKYDG